MLSVIVTGRNDAHGYNLHKRIALSLNCLAEALGRDDEIIFVDWNSPDEMPTVAEAVADTLTEPCRRRLRILRVRPHQHRRVCRLSHLPLIDPIARNVAIRRAKPGSSWILSTSTDVIPVPRNADRTLRHIVPSLGPALYQLPRFDLPESLWETLDRKDPAAAIAACAQWGRSLHLNEVVEADPIVKYDGPGDFQLLPLAAAQQLCGFDERMVYTYHSDSNLAKRAGFLLGPVRSLIDDLFLYHCNHYRQTSVHHGPARAENSWNKFFESVEGPSVPGQDESWGLADDEVEEISLPTIGQPRIAAALAAVLPPAAETFWRVANRPDTYNRLDYRTAHVLPFIVDLLEPMPRNANLGVFGASDELLHGLASAWTELGFAGRILIAGPDERLPGLCVSLARQSEIIEQSAVLLFDFVAAGTAEPFADARRLGQLAATADSFRDAVASERDRAAAGRLVQPKRFIVVNAINTVFERLVISNLVFTYTPFSGRVRHGTAALPADPLATDIASLAGWLAPRIGRCDPVSYQEIIDALETIGDAFAAGRPAPAATAVLGLLEHPRLGEALGVPSDRWRDWGAASRAARPSHRYAARLSVPLRGPISDRQPTANRLATIEDWERPRWVGHLLRNEETAGFGSGLQRHRATWQIGQLLYAVSATGEAGAVKRGRVVLCDRNPLPVYLSRTIPAVEVVAGGCNGDLDEVWPVTGLAYDPGRIHTAGFAGGLSGDNGTVELLVLPDNAVLAGGVAGFLTTLADCERLLAVGGLLVFAVEVVISDDRADDRLPGGLLASGEFERLVSRCTGLAPEGGSDWRLTPATLDRIAIAGTESERQPHFVVQIGTLLSTTAVLSWRKQRTTTEADWLRLERSLAVPLGLSARLEAGGRVWPRRIG